MELLERIVFGHLNIIVECEVGDESGDNNIRECIKCIRNCWYPNIDVILPLDQSKGNTSHHSCQEEGAKCLDSCRKFEDGGQL